jgi:hypothetical protein
MKNSTLVPKTSETASLIAPPWEAPSTYRPLLQKNGRPPKVVGCMERRPVEHE